MLSSTLATKLGLGTTTARTARTRRTRTRLLLELMTTRPIAMASRQLGYLLLGLGLKETGIDQLALHSVQLGYLKILQVGNTDPNNTKVGNKYEVKPQYEAISKQLIMQHAIINAMKCMRAIKDRIARPVYQLAIISVSLYTRTVYQPGKSSVRDLQSPCNPPGSSDPQSYTNRGTLGQDFTESVEQIGSSRFLKSTVPVSKLVSIGKETQEEFSATNIIQNNGGTRRQSTKECYGEQ
ncbi:hypothetical protein F511_25116 [Dorcoceras hygrometricum]|uniref:Uncharacterized protein n=1 Tax=Dorcoceras hygrometricum TaxID=472368 RepID=A0A2Z7AAI9_9LAMI|nr:hypothetical protein F511_25116 [Dorcoceras hygrometricum]